MFNIRLALPCDVKDVFELSNDKDVRKNSIDKEFISWENHVVWFENKISSPDVKFYIIEVRDKFAGYLRLDKHNDKSYWLITIHLKKEYRSMGFGYNTIQEIIKNGNIMLISYVNKNNIVSSRMFEKLGFNMTGTKKINNEEYYIYKRG